jgi:ABC-type amino acid transport substrate-binding protein
MGRRFLIVIATLLIGATVTLCGWFLIKIVMNLPRPPGLTSKQTPQPTPQIATCNGPVQTGVLGRITSRKSIIMGVQEDAPPMNYVETDEKDSDKTTRKGFDYDLAKLIAAQFSFVGPEIVKVKEVDAFEKLFCLLKEKDGDQPSVDIIMSGIARDDEMPDIEWSDPYFDFGYALIAKKSSDIKNLNDCKTNKSRVGIVKGDSVVEAYVKSKLPKAEIVPMEDEDNWINAINLGTVDVVIYDFPFAVTEVRLLNEEKSSAGVEDDYLEIKKPSLPDSESQYCIGIPAGNPDLKTRIDAAISRLKGSPKYVDLVKKYFQSSDVRKPDKPGKDVPTYTVHRGDSLSKIALKELGDVSRWPELKDLNNVGTEYFIFPNQILIMPADYKH